MKKSFSLCCKVCLLHLIPRWLTLSRCNRFPVVVEITMKFERRHLEYWSTHMQCLMWNCRAALLCIFLRIVFLKAPLYEGQVLSMCSYFFLLSVCVSVESSFQHVSTFKAFLLSITHLCDWLSTAAQEILTFFLEVSRIMVYHCKNIRFTHTPGFVNVLASRSDQRPSVIW